jgi:hypothetical protein
MIKQISQIIPNEDDLEWIREVTQNVSKQRHRPNLDADQTINSAQSDVHKYMNTLVKDHADIPKTVERNGQKYKFVMISRGLTYTRYNAGGCFGMHRDSPVNMRGFETLFTLLIYLNDDETGATMLYPGAVDIEPDMKMIHNGDVVKRMRSSPDAMSVLPRTNDAVLFDIRTPHESLPCAGEKMMISCKIMYIPVPT